MDRRRASSKNHNSNSIWNLLNKLIDDFPRRKQEAESYMQSMGIDEELKMEISPPDPLSDVPSINPIKKIPLSPMLKDRYEFAGEINFGGSIWLSLSDQEQLIKDPNFLPYHKALRENWDDSAPFIFPDDQLSIFGCETGVPEDLVYLVWKQSNIEPEIWEYSAYEERKFENLEKYFFWCLTRD